MGWSRCCRFFFVLTALWLGAGSAARAQGGFLYYHGVEVDDRGDTTYVIKLPPLYFFSHPMLKTKADYRRYDKMIRNLRIVYPLAAFARDRMRRMEVDLAGMDRREANKYMKRLEDELKKEYTPVLKRMTYSQGKILLKLIDRETGNTSYEIVREFRGSVSAFFWQGVARIFGANLKEQYDAEGEDQVLEQLILLYESGMLDYYSGGGYGYN